MPEPRVCVVSPLYHSSLGGLGRQALLLTERLAEMGVPLFVITRRMRTANSGARERGFRIIRIRTPWPSEPILEAVGLKSILISLTFSLGAAWNLFRRRSEYDIVHFHGARAVLYATLPLLLLLKKRTVVKVSAANHPLEVGSLTGRHGLPGKILARLARKADRYVAISSEIGKGLLRDGIPEQAIVRVPNFVEAVSPRKKTGKEIFGLERKSVVLFSGRLVERKGVDTLLRAWNIVSQKHRDAVLLILGDGPLRAALEAMAQRLNISASVRFLGWREDVDVFLGFADAFVQPSLQEGLSNALLEAMAFGLPIAATRIGGNEDVIRDGENGLLVKPNDPAALAEAIGVLLTQREQAATLGRNALITIRDHHDRDAVCRKYVALYRELCAVKP